VAAVYMILPYTGQFCYGPRYWIPYVPWLALALMLGLKLYEGRKYCRRIRLAVTLLVVVSAVMSVTAAAMAPAETWHQPPWHALAELFRA